MKGVTWKRADALQAGDLIVTPMCHGVIAAFLLARSPSWKSLRRPTPW